MRIGIPRALLAYYYLPLWETFFTYLGAEVVISPKTNNELLDTGVELAVDEACLPVKVFLGHVNFLKSRVDVLFLPRIVSVEPKKYTCPKLIGMPDMVKTNIADLPAIWNDTVNLSSGTYYLLPIVYQIGRRLSPNILKIMQAYWAALRQLRRYQDLLRKGYMADEAYDMQNSGDVLPPNEKRALTIAVVGHAYNIYDTYISMRIIPRLRDMGVRVITPEMMHAGDINQATKHMSKDIFWTFCKRIMGTACHYIYNYGEIDGIIDIASFGCGPDSLVGEMLEREARRQASIPFMLLTLDEHTGEAGLLTRLEAFIDMISRRGRGNAGNFSSYGDLISNT
ncbi:MAG TPA: acyl-CoA dehydratase activase-related protein [Ruminiclostridium sp.]|nr:acyl-CoA dehydratase activase-related protein [Ruminiclostridium sp.]